VKYGDLMLMKMDLHCTGYKWLTSTAVELLPLELERVVALEM
jgi:hypothetical protein